MNLSRTIAGLHVIALVVIMAIEAMWQEYRIVAYWTAKLGKTARRRSGTEK